MKKLITLIFIILSIISYSQNVTVSIENLKANNVTVPNGSPIDLGTDSSINVTFRVDLEKHASYTIGPAQVWISVFDSSGNRTDRYITPVPEGEFTTGASADYDFDILDSEIDFGSGNYLSAVLKQDNYPGAEWESQHIPIIKTPAFELSPNSLSLVCGDTSQKTFTVTNNSNLSGVVYLWNIGSGWFGSVDNSNSITLTPIDGTVLPSNVSVTPIYNGVNQQTLTSNITWSSFTPSYPITGTYTLCSSATYSIDNLPSGTTIQSWSSSDPNIATVSTLNATQAELTAVGNGTVTVTATVINACGQTANINSEPVFVGDPNVSNTTIIGGSNNVAINTSSQLSVNWSDGATGYYWFITTIHSSCPTGGVPPKFQTGSGSASTITTSYPFVNVLWGDCTGDYIINCRAINSCGSTDYKYKSVTVYDPNSGGDPCDDYGLKIKSNPIKGDNVGIIMYRPAPGGDPCDDLNRIAEKRKTTSYNITLYDFKGYVVHNQNYKSERVTLNNLKLKSGIYILNITSSDGISKQKTLVVK